MVGLSIGAAMTATFFAGLSGRCDFIKLTSCFLAILVGKALLLDTKLVGNLHLFFLICGFSSFFFASSLAFACS